MHTPNEDARPDGGQAPTPAQSPMARAAAWLRALDGLGRIAAFLAAFIAIAGVLHVMATALFGRDAGLLGQAGPGRVATYVLFLCLAFVFHRATMPGRHLGLRPYAGWGRTILKGWLYGIAGYVLYSLLMRAAGVVEFRTPKSAANVVGAIAVSLFAGAGVATAEEILFRGFLLRAAADALPRWPAIILTGVVFGFFHDLANPLDFIVEPSDRMLFGGVFCLHLLLCACVLRTRTLHLGIGIHSGLVFGESLYRKLRIYDVVRDDSWLWGLDADPRRGLLAWGLFLASIAAIPLLVGARARAEAERREPITFTPAAPPWLLRLLEYFQRPSRRVEAACWIAVGLLAAAPRLLSLVRIPFPLLPYGGEAILDAAHSLAGGQMPAGQPAGGWLLVPVLAGLLRSFGHLDLLPWIQHAAVLGALAAGIVAMRVILGRAAVIPLAAAAAACVCHGGAIHVAHHVVPGAFQFALTAVALAAWSLRLWGRGPAFAVAAAFFAGFQAMNGLHFLPLLLVIVARELAQPGAPRARLSCAALAIGTACAPAAALVLFSVPASTLPPPTAGSAVYASVAHLESRPRGIAPGIAQGLEPLLTPMGKMSPDQRKRQYSRKIQPFLAGIEPDEARREILLWRLTATVAASHPREALGIWRQNGRDLLWKNGRNLEWPGPADLQRTARVAGYSRAPAAAEIGRQAEAARASIGKSPARMNISPGLAVWLFEIAPPFLAALLLLIAAVLAGRPPLRWFAAGCLAAALPLLLLSCLVVERNERDLAGLLPIAMAALSVAFVLACAAAARALKPETVSDVGAL